MADKVLKQAQENHQAGRFAEAEGLYRQVLAGDPDRADAIYGLGLVLFASGKTAEAAAFIGKAIAKCPERADYRYNQGVILNSLGRRGDAIASLREAIKLKGDFPDAIFNLACALQTDGNLSEAIAEYRRLIELHPNYAAAYVNLGNAYYLLNQLGDSVATYQEACRLRPDLPVAWQGLGNSLRKMNEDKFALEAYGRAIEIDPRLVPVLRAMSGIYSTTGRHEENVELLRRLLAIDPTDAAAHWSLAWSLLVLGFWEEGWVEAEWRPRDERPELQAAEKNIWDGGSISGKRLLIYSDGGHGDEINLARFIPMAAAASGAQIIFECHPALGELFRQIPGVWKLIGRGEALPDFDEYVSVLSLPRIFRTTVENVPGQSAYLVALGDRVEKFRGEIPGGRELKVGLIWSGTSGESDARTRTIEAFGPLARIPNVRFFSLQKGAEGSEPPPDGMKLIDLTSEIKDFADAAGLLSHLDLLITVDTAGAHLAGAMGKPVWMLNPFMTDYRWLLDREDSVWYPTMRIFRQPANKNWGIPISQIKTELQVVALRHWGAGGVKVSK
jgi:tetratricopeptide (TPR) repeat protein